MVSNNRSSRFVTLDFYDGAYGATLRIDIPSRELLEALKGVFQSLAQKKHHEVELAKADFVHAGNVTALDLELEEHPKTQGRSKTLHLEHGMKFVWNNTAAGWQYCSDLLDGFGEQPGHQYLTTEGIDDALIEAAFLER